jgi:hypothetical protein
MATGLVGTPDLSSAARTAIWHVRSGAGVYRVDGQSGRGSTMAAAGRRKRRAP